MDLRHQTRSRALFSLVLAATLFMRILVPSGWMPVAEASGFRIQLCSGWTSQPQPAPAADHHLHDVGHHAHADKGPAEPQESSHSGQPCAFAGLGMAFLDAPALPSLAALPFDTLAPETLPQSAPARRLAAPPPPSTGPPPIA